jgi:hypothetical protein
VIILAFLQIRRLQISNGAANLSLTIVIKLASYIEGHLIMTSRNGGEKWGLYLLWMFPPHGGLYQNGKKLQENMMNDEGDGSFSNILSSKAQIVDMNNSLSYEKRSPWPEEIA